MTEAVKELVAAADLAWKALAFHPSEERDAKRLRAAVEAVKAEEKPQGCPHCSCSCMDCAPCGQPPDALIPQTGGE
jgi:hypothetical protein